MYTWRARLGDKVIAVGIESVMYQKALKQAIDTAGRAAGLMIPTRELHPASDKILRLTRTQPAFEQGLVHVMKTEHGVVVDEVTGFTRDGKIHPKNDDAMDMLVYGVSLAESRGLTDLYGSFHL
jgi:predicted phage terminase large subunit-like protein